MCGRVTLLSPSELDEVLESIGSGTHLHLGRADSRAQARPGSQLQAIAPARGSLEIAPFTWGFDAPWDKGLVFNTRIESALGGTRMWAGPIREGRCILPVATFFEPHATETTRSPRTGKPMARQYEFASPDGEPLLLASVQQEGRLSVVTTEPNGAVAPIHKRMPLVLRFEEVRTWLGDDFAQLADRSHVELTANFEDGNDPQLSLF